MSGKQLSCGREGGGPPCADSGPLDGIADTCADLEAPVSRYLDLAAGEARREALARWPLLAEIDRSLSRQQSASPEPDPGITKVPP